MSSQINIVTFLTKVLSDTQGGAPGCVNVTPDERQWIETYLHGPHIELHLRARIEQETADTEPRPVDEQFFVKGNHVDIFTLLQSLCDKSPQMAWIISALGRYIYHNALAIIKPPQGEWTFNINTQSNEQNNNPGAPAGGL